MKGEIGMGVTGSLVIAEHGKWDHLNPFNMPEEDIVFTKFVINNISLAWLHAIVMQCAYESVADTYFENQVYSDPDEACLWVHAVPSAFVTRLAQLPDDELARVALAWKNTEELSDPVLTPDWVRQLLTDIRALCNRALQQNRQVYLLTML